MSTAESWDLTVPEDEAELLAELRRHGVRPGQHLHVLDDEAVEAVRRALGAMRAAIDSGLTEKIRTLMAGLPDVKLPAVVPPDLSGAQRAALEGLLSALDEASSVSRTRPEGADETRSRRRLRFTGMIDGPSDLSARTDEYLAQGFGRD